MVANPSFEDMIRSVNSILRDPDVRAAIKSAWIRSDPGVSDGPEEGGFVLEDETSALSVVFWFQGDRNEIVLLPHRDCRFAEHDIIASFHTHPNTGRDFMQEPSETDRRAVRDDAGLKGRNYVGEFVISQTSVYLIDPDGQILVVGATTELLSLK